MIAGGFGFAWRAMTDFARAGSIEYFGRLYASNDPTMRALAERLAAWTQLWTFGAVWGDRRQQYRLWCVCLSRRFAHCLNTQKLWLGCYLVGRTRRIESHRHGCVLHRRHPHRTRHHQHPPASLRSSLRRCGSLGSPG